MKRRKKLMAIVGLVLALLVLPQLYKRAAASSQESTSATTRANGFDFYDVRLGHTPEEKAALERLESALQERDNPGGLVAQSVSSEARQRGAGLRKGTRTIEELQSDIDRARTRLSRRVPGLSVTRDPAAIRPEIVEAKSAPNQFLTQASREKPETVLRRFVSQNAALYGLTKGEAEMLKAGSRYVNPARNLSWLSLRQQIDGIPVFQGELLAAFTRNGELVRTVSNLAAGLETEGKPTRSSAEERGIVAQSVETKLSAADAVARAAQSIGISIDPNGLVLKEASADGTSFVFERGPFSNEIEVSLVYFALKGGVVNLAWSMVLWLDSPPAYYTLVDASEGELLWRKNITNDQSQTATYVVYNDDSPAPLSPTNATPGSGIQGAPIARTSFTLVSELPAFDNLGWITDGGNTTTGNNVDAGLDLVAPNGIDPAGRPTGTPFRVFDFPYNPAPGIPPPGDAPTLADYRFGAVTNLFFWSNRYHDRLYELGFTEPARNFQQDNFGRGGLGNDRVLAEAQDSSGTNNANFATPADGSSGRMQMFIFTGPNPDRDGDLDADVFLHELTHGTSNRLHGNASGLTGTQAGGMGEGWSDFYARALLATADEDVNGIYAAGAYVTLNLGALGTDNYYYGIRRFPYAVKTNLGLNGRPHNPLTFADIDPAQINTTDGAFPRNPAIGNTANEVHNIGEVWCMALLEVRARIITRLGFATGNQRTLQIVTDGMKLDPLNPNLLQGRNSILAADCAGFGGADELDIWSGFATRGMGFSARVNAGSSVTEAFDVPNLTIGNVTVTDDSCDNAGAADPGETVTLNIPLTNPFCGTTATGVSAAIVGFGTASYGDIAPGATATQGITFTVPSSTPCGTVLTLSVNITSSLGPVTRTINLQIGTPTSQTPPTVYGTGNIATPIPDVSTVDIPVLVTDPGVVGDVNVRLRLNHTFDGDLVISLISPDGTSVALATNRGGSGDNYGAGANDCSGIFTIFDDSAGTAIGAGIAPFTGSFRPESPLAGFSGHTMTGTWTLRVADTATLDTGTVGCVQLEIRRQLFFCCGVPGTPIINAAPPAVVTAESCSPPNGAPDPDETVTMTFPLKNVGTGLTTDLVATLLPGGGVNTPSGPQTYGVLSPVGPAVAKPFTFVPTGPCGGTVVATFSLKDGSTDLGTVSFNIKLGATFTNNTMFSNGASISIPAGAPTTTSGAAAPYPSTINVSGIVGTVTKVTATLTGMNHTFPDDIDVLLVGPGGQKLLLMSDAGGSLDLVGVNLTFDDGAASALPDSTQIVSGTFRPTNFGTGDTFPAPAPAGPYPDPQLLSVFNGINPNGTWSLFVFDDAGADVGSITGGWSLSITTADPVCCDSPCTLTCPADITVGNDPGVCSAVVTYTIPPVSGSCGVVTSTPPSGSVFPVGTTTVTVKATRQDGGMSTCTFKVKVNDVEKPSIAGASVNPSVLWPVDHKMIDVTVSYSVSDNCTPAAGIVCDLTVSSNQPIDGVGDGHTSKDWEVVDAHHVKLRAERSGTLTDRIYTITITCRDASGNATTKTVAVTVPHDQSL